MHVWLNCERDIRNFVDGSFAVWTFHCMHALIEDVNINRQMKHPHKGLSRMEQDHILPFCLYRDDGAETPVVELCGAIDSLITLQVPRRARQILNSSNLVGLITPLKYLQSAHVKFDLHRQLFAPAAATPVLPRQPDSPAPVPAPVSVSYTHLTLPTILRV